MAKVNTIGVDDPFGLHNFRVSRIAKQQGEVGAKRKPPALRLPDFYEQGRLGGLTVNIVR